MPRDCTALHLTNCRNTKSHNKWSGVQCDDILDEHTNIYNWVQGAVARWPRCHVFCSMIFIDWNIHNKQLNRIAECLWEEDKNNDLANKLVKCWQTVNYLFRMFYLVALFFFSCKLDQFIDWVGIGTSAKSGHLRRITCSRKLVDILFLLFTL